MIFKKIALENDIFSQESNLSSILKEECSKADTPMIDLISLNIKDSLISSKSLISIDSFKELNEEKKISKRIKRNNVTPISSPNNITEITYQASSPDEVALVKFAHKLNMKLIYRSDKEIHIQNANNVLEEYEILANFPFSSDSKRMGIVVKHKKHDCIFFYLKGAEHVIEHFVKEEYVSFIKEHEEALASIGLRTLVLTQKIIPNEFYNEWLVRYNDAITSIENRKELINKAISELENQMNFLSVTEVEDLLQDDVSITIENLRNAGMKIWMLTGDKRETAACISISA